MRVWAEIDLGKIQYNFSYIKKVVGPQVKMLAVVKSDAYGHGAVPVSQALIRTGADWLGVGDSSEALELRESGIRVPILILGAILADELEEVVHHDISICIHSEDRLKSLQKMAESRQKQVGVHLKIDTGMGRLGTFVDTALRLLPQILNSKYIRLQGICTHFSNGTALNQAFTFEQLKKFESFLRQTRSSLPVGTEIHAAASSTLFHFPEARYSMVRPGISLYGMDPGNLYRYPLEPALALKTKVIYLKDMPPGSSVGYDLNYCTYKPTRIATLPVGYNDGYRTTLSNRSRVLIRGQFAPVVGRITMDYTMVDVTHIPEVQVGEEVTLIGKQGEFQIRAEDLASWGQSIPYEVTCGLGKRVRKIYKQPSKSMEHQTHSIQTLFFNS
ncbi:MAG: alanine racemase [Planctomycetota bacterium]